MTVPEHERDFDEAGEWVLVPRKATPEMTSEIFAWAYTPQDDPEKTYPSLWAALLAARPTPPESEQGGSSISPEMAELVEAIERALKLATEWENCARFADVDEARMQREHARRLRSALSPFRGTSS